MSASSCDPPRVHIVGRRNSGKTTLVCELVRDLTARGLRVATIKHTHHHHELDTPGKDSWKHRDAGAAGVGILSPHLLAAFIPGDRDRHDHRGYALFQTVFQDCDLLLVEGDLHSDALRLEVWRPDVAEPPYAQKERGIHAVISDTPDIVDGPVWPRSDVAAMSDRIIHLLNIRMT